jgi:ABC-2 type transport system permease protein
MKKYIQIIRSEYIHLIRSPFKTLSLSLFVLAILYSCQNGYALFKKHNIEITNIVANNEDSIAKMLDQYEEIENGTQEKTRRDPTTPYWAIWNTPSYAFKYPSPMMVFSLGQAEQYGYYKKITNWSTTFDSDMAEEIANPERLAIGTLDFNFVFIYLFPILIIILLFNVGGLEKDLNFEKLILLNNITKRKWLFIRFLFYFILINILLLSLMLFYALIADVFQNETLNFIRLLFTSILYIILWFIIFYFINYYGKNSSDQALKMISIWLLLCIIIDRDKSNDIFKLPTNTLRMQLFDKFPKLEKTFFANDLDIDKSIINRSLSGLINIENKNIALAIENSNEQKNKFIKSFYPINPVIAFQNQINSLTNTDYYSYLIYRREIQSMIDKKIDIILKDTWNNITVNKEIYTEYIRNFK